MRNKWRRIGLEILFIHDVCIEKIILVPHNLLLINIEPSFLKKKNFATML